MRLSKIANIAELLSSSMGGSIVGAMVIVIVIISHS